MVSRTNRPSPTRRRRSALEAQTAILDAAEARLVEGGPGSIRLQDVAADVGVSHPTVLHHFGSREGLIEAVVKRALESIQSGLVEAVQQAPGQSDAVTHMLETVFAQMKHKGRARAFLWLTLGGYVRGVEGLHLRPLADLVHEVRRIRRAGKKKLPPFDDTHFTIVLPALALLTLAALESHGVDPQFDGARFRAWLAKLLHEHLERE